jgi:hypothetical protein
LAVVISQHLFAPSDYFRAQLLNADEYLHDPVAVSAPDAMKIFDRSQLTFVVLEQLEQLFLEVEVIPIVVFIYQPVNVVFIHQLVFHDDSLLWFGGLRDFTAENAMWEKPETEPRLVAPRTLARCRRGCG